MVPGSFVGGGVAMWPGDAAYLLFAYAWISSKR